MKGMSAGGSSNFAAVHCRVHSSQQCLVHWCYGVMCCIVAHYHQSTHITTEIEWYTST